MKLRTSEGFTILELMVTVVVLAIVMALAAPSFSSFVEKRALTAAAEEITRFVEIGRSSAIKRNMPVRMTWDGSSGHSNDFCIGMSEGTASCDCWETNPADSDYCAVDGMAYRLEKTDFVRINSEFLHFRPADGWFQFDPVQGHVARSSASEVIDGDWLFYMHSDEGSGSTRLYGLEIKLWATGKTEICYQNNRKIPLATYPLC